MGFLLFPRLSPVLRGAPSASEGLGWAVILQGVLQHNAFIWVPSLQQGHPEAWPCAGSWPWGGDSVSARWGILYTMALEVNASPTLEGKKCPGGAGLEGTLSPQGHLPLGTPRSYPWGEEWVTSKPCTAGVGTNLQTEFLLFFILSIFL